MKPLEDKRYSISEVGELLDLPGYVLRQWETRFPQLKPQRNHAKQRYYLLKDIEIVRRIKQLLRHEGMTTEGAIKRLSQELYGAGKPQTNQDVLDLLDKIEDEARAMMHLLDSE